MGLFVDEFGEAIWWRIVAAALATVVSATALAVALFGPRPQATGTEREQVLPPVVATPSVAQDTTQVEAWLATIEGAEALSSMEEADKQSLRYAVLGWQASTGKSQGLTLGVTGYDSVPGIGTRILMHASWPEGETWLELTRTPEGTWSVVEHAQGFTQAPDARIAISDTAQLSALVGEAAADIVLQLQASGLEGASGAWTTAGAISREGTLLRMRLWLPSDANPDGVAYEATFDEAVRELQIVPAAEPVGATL